MKALKRILSSGNDCERGTSPLIMKLMLGLLFFLGQRSFVIAQFGKYEPKDSLFTRYSPPAIGKGVYDRLENDGAAVYFACYFQTDTSGKISSRQVQPLYRVGNRYRRKDSIWSLLSNALTRASGEWAFRILSWDLGTEKDLEKRIDKKPSQRPFGGTPRWLIIYEISGITGSIVDKISYVNDFVIRRR